MNERWVLNASPIIALAHAGCAHLIPALSEQAVIPAPVAGEIRAGPADDPAALWIESQVLDVVEIPDPPQELLAWDLGAGETAVLAYAMAHAGWVAVLDDASARRCAHSFGVPLLGTLAIIVRARQSGLIESAAGTLRSLRSAGFRLDDALVRSVLRTAVGEEWPTG